MNNDKYTDGELFKFISGSSISGESTYDIWKSLNPDGTAEEFLNYLKADAVSKETLAQIENNKTNIIKLYDEINNCVKKDIKCISPTNNNKL